MVQVPRPDNVHEAFQRQARATPTAIALRTRSRTLSYAELDDASEACAAMLRAHGVGSGRRVGLLLPRSVDAIIAILGTLKTGAAFVPLDPDYPPASLTALVRIATRPSSSPAGMALCFRAAMPAGAARSSAWSGSRSGGARGSPDPMG